MKKYFKFTRWRQCYKGFIVVMVLLIVLQFRNTNMTVDEIIVADLLITGMCVLASLVIDWVKIIQEEKKDNADGK